MNFFEAMKALAEGKKVKCKEGSVETIIYVDKHGNFIDTEGLKRYLYINNCNYPSWELYEEPETKDNVSWNQYKDAINRIDELEKENAKLKEEIDGDSSNCLGCIRVRDLENNNYNMKVENKELERKRQGIENLYTEKCAELEGLKSKALSLEKENEELVMKSKENSRLRSEVINT